MLKKTSSMEMPLDFAKWTVEKTCQYLEKEGLGQWTHTFEEHKITGDWLQGLTVANLKGMGIEQLNDCEKILLCISKLWQIPGKVFNDPIHGHVELHPLLIKIIDTPQFQRLRHIKQLGGGYFVYPGASHNRFEHSIGVAHLAGELVKSLSARQPELDITPRDILCVQIAGLCHDLGHGPFSHLFGEMFIPKAEKRKEEEEKKRKAMEGKKEEKPEAKREEKWKPEIASCEMFDHLVKSNQLEEKMKAYGLVLPEDQDFIKEMIAGPPNSSTDQGKWPYRGRPEDKSFLYEIVSNKTNEIDVDMFDCFARDSYHLGTQNNFDHCRFLKFARVCKVEAGVTNTEEKKWEKHICTRDKEVGNLYDMFHTRYCLHRRAYQHKVTILIQSMITDAFLEADKHIQIEGSGGKIFTLSTAIDDMEAYTKLTDRVFEDILFSTSMELEGAREILGRIISRKLYMYLGEKQTEEPTKPFIPISDKLICDWKKELAKKFGDKLTEDDFEIMDIIIDNGKKDKDPLYNTYVYTKEDDIIGISITEVQETRFIPKYPSERTLRFYCKKTDNKTLHDHKKIFEAWKEQSSIDIK